MKKILIVLSMFLLIGCGYCKTVSNPDILTLFSSKSDSCNKVWIGTFQLVFNDMKNNIVKKDIVFEKERQTKELKGLNSEEFNSLMLNDSSYYKSYGETSFEARDKIKADLKEKFDTTSDILDTLDWSKGYGKYYAYAMLKKEFEFLTPFDKLDEKSFNNSKEKYKFFGIKNDSKKELDDNVAVLFYNNKDDYAVRLYTTNGDIVYLYATDSNKDFKSLFNEMQKKSKKYKDERFFLSEDTLSIPDLKFKKERKYTELCNKIIKDTPEMYFSDAIETIEISLDNKGGKVKSEAAIMAKCMALPMIGKNKPRHFDFDKTFVLFLIDKAKEDPYMALRVKDLKGLQ